MASNIQVVESYLAKLQSLQIGDWTSKAMFGEYGFYLEGKIVAMVCDDQLFIKASDEALAQWGEHEKLPPYPRAKPQFVVQAQDFRRKKDLAQLIQASLVSIPKPKKKLNCK